MGTQPGTAANEEGEAVAGCYCGRDVGKVRNLAWTHSGRYEARCYPSQVDLYGLPERAEAEPVLVRGGQSRERSRLRPLPPLSSAAGQA